MTFRPVTMKKVQDIRQTSQSVSYRTTLLHRISYTIVVIFSGLIFMAPSASANTGVSQGYTTTTANLVAGTIMGLTTNTHDAEPASSGHAYQLLGLVADQPLIALSDGTHQVQIVISGTSEAIVSNINGNIEPGDKITSSPIDGVGMKATDAGQIVGTAEGSLSDTQSVSRTITDKYGKKQTIKIGAIPLQVSVSYYAGSSSQGTLASILPPFLLSTANGLAGQEVSPVRVLIALLTLVFGFVVVGIMLQSAIRSGIIAIGRNPLAKKALRRELIDISLTALGILLLTIIVVYVIIKI
jgi:hypothetical protein